MNKLVFLGALPAALAFPPSGIPSGLPIPSEHHIPAYPSFTSTVYATSTYTVSSCGPTVTNCPYGNHGPVVVTEVVPVSTTVCAVTEKEAEETTVDWGCNTSTSFSECVHTVTSTVAPYLETTEYPTATYTTTEVSTEYSTCVHTVTNATKPYVATTVYPLSTYTTEVVTTEYSTCVHTVTNATTEYPETTVFPVTTYTVCPVKPTGTGAPFPIDVPTTWPAGVPKPTGSYTKTAPASIVTAGAASFGASGALLLGAALAALVL